MSFGVAEQISVEDQIRNGDFIGWTPDLSNEFYHGEAKAYLSSTQLNWMYEGMEYFNWRRRQPQEYSEDLIIGSVTHLLLEFALKGQHFKLEDHVALLPKGVASPANAKWAGIVKEHPGKYLLSREHFNLAQKMAESVLGEPEAMEYLRNGLAEVSCFAMYPGTNIKVKCRPDFLRVDDGISVNFKTIKPGSANKEAFRKLAPERGYDWQSAFYIDIEKATFGRDFDEVHLLVEKNEDGPKCKVGLFTIENTDLDYARSQFRKLLPRYEECLKTNVWPSEPTKLECITVSDWHRRIVE
jgi:exodeoxyribonuclease VIII